MAEINYTDAFFKQKKDPFLNAYNPEVALPELQSDNMFEFDFTKSQNPLTDPQNVAQSYTDKGWDFGKMFDGDNIGSTLGGIGTGISGAAAIYNAYQTKQYQDKLFKMEKERVDRANERQAKAQAAYDNSKGWSA